MATTASKIKEIEDEMSKTQKNKVSGAEVEEKHHQMKVRSRY
jgi:ribosome-interacting GTPase 1